MRFFSGAKKYLVNQARSLDQSLNSLFGGDPDETMSSRLGKSVRDDNFWLAKGICKFLNIFQKDHCKKSINDGDGKDGLF